MAEDQSAREHLEGFARSFISREFRPRWRHILLEKPEKAGNELRRFEGHNDQRHCRLVESAHDLLDEISGATRGLYFDGSGPGSFMSLDQGIAEATGKFVDALFSISPGENAVFLFHDGWAWVCGASES